MEYITKTFQETQKLGQEIGSSLVGGEILALKGDLGSGKTTFMQGLARGLGIEKSLNSPTFIIVRNYQISNLKSQTISKDQNSNIKTLIHVDLYRLESNISQELENLGIMEEMENPESVVAIEWAEKAREFLPERTKWVEFSYLGESKRRIVISE